MERLNRKYNDIDWVGRYNSDKLSSLRVNELSLYFSHQKITSKGKKAGKVAMIKAQYVYNSMERKENVMEYFKPGDKPGEQMRMRQANSEKEIPSAPIRSRI